VAKKKNTKAVKQTAKPASKGKEPVKTPVKKVRGGLISFLVIFIFFHAIFAAVLLLGTMKAGETASAPWVLPLLTLVALADIVAAFGIWYWKKWGIYLFAATCVAQAAVHLMMTAALLVVFYDLLPLAILAYVITLQSKMALFE
jgi:hypothetical protein